MPRSTPQLRLRGRHRHFYRRASLGAYHAQLRLWPGLCLPGPDHLHAAFPILTIAMILGLAFIMNYSGMSATLGLAFTAAGVAFPVLLALPGLGGCVPDRLGHLLQRPVQLPAENHGPEIGVDPHLMVAANSSGGVTGKMISPQSIAVACAATGLVGEEGAIFRWTFFHSVAMCWSSP